MQEPLLRIPMTIIQFPNKLLTIVLVAELIRLISSGLVLAGASAVFYLILAIWSYQELTLGVNTFRKILGGSVLGYLIITLTLTLIGCID
jgi:hypothetical protein